MSAEGLSELLDLSVFEVVGVAAVFAEGQEVIAGLQGRGGQTQLGPGAQLALQTRTIGEAPEGHDQAGAEGQEAPQELQPATAAGDVVEEAKDHHQIEAGLGQRIHQDVEPLKVIAVASPGHLEEGLAPVDAQIPGLSPGQGLFEAAVATPDVQHSPGWGGQDPGPAGPGVGAVVHKVAGAGLVEVLIQGQQASGCLFVDHPRTIAPVGRYTRDHFRPEEHEQALIGIVAELQGHAHIDGRLLTKVLNRHPKGAGLSFSKAELIRGVEVLAPRQGWDAPSLVARLRMKPMRTQSGVVPVTVLTKPFPCPGRCVFCPSDVRMPKSYLSMEPGAQRAAQLHFDPYAQTRSRILALLGNGHPIDKVELIILGGTWSSYPESYQRWFIRRCFDALNQLHEGDREQVLPDPRLTSWDTVQLDGALGRYNQRVTDELERRGQWRPAFEDASWAEVEEAHRLNESARCRSVGLVIETRPDRIDEVEAQRLRRLGVTKVQLGYQSTDDRILALNQRGHDVDASRRATGLLRRYGFKIHGHYMLNLLGATPESDLLGLELLFDDPSLRPDELKLYPCSLIETAELMEHYQSGAWAPYAEDVLVELLAQCLARVPRWCRVTRVIRDIPSQDIVVGNKRSNLREDAEAHADRRRLPRVEIRSREIRARPIEPTELQRRDSCYRGPAGEDHFLEWIDPQGHIAGFLRLFLPAEVAPLPELVGAALLREVHVYGQALSVGEGPGPAQHQGLGRRLIEEATRRVVSAGFERLSVISAVGTRAYYRGLGFEDGELYQHLRTSASLGARR